jgi:hypothetical protein
MLQLSSNLPGKAARFIDGEAVAAMITTLPPLRRTHGLMPERAQSEGIRPLT